MPAYRDIDFPLRGDHIPLDSLLKVCAVAQSGGQAKSMVADGLITVDGEVELRKTAKIRDGQTVIADFAGVRIRVQAEAA